MMKSLTPIPLILLFLTLSFTTFAQDIRSVSYLNNRSPKCQANINSAEVFLLDSVHVYRMNSDADSALLRRNANRYNAAGHLTYTDEQMRYFNTNTQQFSDWDTSWFYRYNYDNAENRVESLELPPGEDYLIRRGYYYSEENTLLKEILTRSFDRVNWDTLATINYEYEKEGRLHSTTEEGQHNTVLTEYTYNTCGKLTEKRISELGTGGETYLFEKTVREYDEIQQLTHERFYGISGNPSLFLMSESWYSYENELLDTVIQTGYNYDGEVWISSRETYEYDTHGKLTGKITGYRHGEEWVNNSCIAYTYNEQDSLVCETDYMWGATEWYGFMKREYQLDESGKRIRQLYYQGASGWVLTEVFHYFYAENMAVTNKSSFPDAVRIYPNPTNGLLYVDITDTENLLILYSFDGKILYEQRLTNGSNLLEYYFSVPGIYLVKLTGGNDIQIKKIIVQ
jgi:hypothetical protein